MQREITHSGPLLTLSGNLSQVGWSRQPLLDCNLEAARFYRFRFLQRFRIKRWDYYAIFTPERFFSATIADLAMPATFSFTPSTSTVKLCTKREGWYPWLEGWFCPATATAGRAVITAKRSDWTLGLRKPSGAFR